MILLPVNYFVDTISEALQYKPRLRCIIKPNIIDKYQYRIKQCYYYISSPLSFHTAVTYSLTRRSFWTFPAKRQGSTVAKGVLWYHQKLYSFGCIYPTAWTTSVNSNFTWKLILTKETTEFDQTGVISMLNLPYNRSFEFDHE